MAKRRNVAKETPRARNKDGSVRKRRADRNHVIYRITCSVTGATYVGITVAKGRAYQASARTRWDGHVRHAIREGRPYPLHAAIREHGPEAFKVDVLDVVRGKGAAHKRERELIAELAPSLNVECTERKLRAGQGHIRLAA